MSLCSILHKWYYLRLVLDYQVVHTETNDMESGIASHNSALLHDSMHEGGGLSHMVVVDHSLLDDEKCDKAVVCAFHYPKVPHVVPCHIMPYSS